MGIKKTLNIFNSTGHKKSTPLFSKPTLAIEKNTQNIIYVNQLVSNDLEEPYSRCRSLSERASSDIINRTISFNGGIYQN